MVPEIGVLDMIYVFSILVALVIGIPSVGAQAIPTPLEHMWLCESDCAEASAELEPYDACIERCRMSDESQPVAPMSCRHITTWGETVDVGPRWYVRQVRLYQCDRYVFHIFGLWRHLSHN
jgi:hypothetical protein